MISFLNTILIIIVSEIYSLFLGVVYVILAITLYTDSRRKWEHLLTSFQCMNSNVDYSVEAPYVVLFKTEEPILSELH